VTQATTLTFRLTATDDQGATASDSADIVINPPGSSPSAQAIGNWRELILNPDGTINQSEYARVAANYHKEEMVNYRLGPSAVDFGAAATSETVYQPDPNGLWKGGTNRALADRFCQTPDRLIATESPTGYGDGAGGGGGWQMSGQMLFVPDAAAPAELSRGVANMRGFDGARAARASDGATVALCMRMRAEWRPDYWNRNNISAPTTPAVDRLLTQYPDLPLPAVATTRGQVQNSITGFLAFQNGVIAAAGTGNDQYCNGFATGTPCETSIRLPAGKTPTALALTAMNEFLLVTVWDAQNQRGQLGVIAVGADDPSNIGNQDAGRYGWGVQSWPGVRGLKLLGFIDLPMQAPNSLGVSISTGTMKFRGFEFWRGPELKTQAGRDQWNARSLQALSEFLPIETQWKLLASAGYAVVGSRAEDRVAVVDLRPLLNFYRTMYFTTQANWDQTANANQGPADNQWPYSFAFRPEQRPVVLASLSVPQPTAVMAWQLRSGTNTLAGWDGLSWNHGANLMTVASMNGAVRQYDVASLIDPPRTPAAPDAPLRTWQVGRNPTQIATPIAGGARTDDLYFVSRGDRQIAVTSYKGDAQALLRDSRLVDPVFVGVGINGAGFGGAGANLALNAQVLTVLDYNGKIVHDYGIFIENYAARYQPGRPGNVEQWPFLAADGRTVLPFNYGYGNRLAGKPFMFSFDEVI
jgi:hypothetical protein